MPEKFRPKESVMPQAEEPQEDKEQEKQASFDMDEEPLPKLTEKEKQRRKEITKEVGQAISEILKQAGFKKKASTWRRESDGVIQVLNLQRSAFSFSFYVNVGIFIKELEPDNKSPKEVDCHYQKRFDNIASDNREERIEIEKYLRFEDDPAAVQGKIENFKNIMAQKILPFFEEHNSKAVLKEKLFNDLRPDAKELLGD